MVVADAAVAEEAPLPSGLAAQPFTSNEDAEGALSTVEKHVIYWIRRWGQSVDDPQKVEARLGPDPFLRLGAERAAYAAVLSCRLTLAAGQWTAALEVTGLRDQKVWQSVKVNASSLVELMDALTETSREIASEVKLRTGQPIKPYVPPSRPYATLPLVLGGVAVVTGATFFILSAIEDGKLSDSSLSLSAAASARNSAKTYQIVGYSMTAVGVVGIVVGLFLFEPGAIPPAPAVSVSADPTRGMLLVGGPLP
jgi:hypothetical protein